MPSHTVRDTPSFGAAVRERRKELGYTQEYLARHLGCSPRFISELERGKPTVEFGKALRVAQMLGIDIIAEKRG